MESVFSSSMYASSNQMCKREPPKAGHLLFISPLKELAIGHFHWAEIGGTGRYQVITGRSTPCVWCFGVGHVSSFESRASNSNVHLRTTGRHQVSTRCVRYSLDSCAERSASTRPHRTRSTGRSGAHRTRAQRGLQNPLKLNAHHQTHAERPVLSVRHPLLKSGHTGRMNREHPTSGAVRPVLNPNRAKH